MQHLTGRLLHKKVIKTKKGKDLDVVSVLDEGEKFSQVVDLTDFDGFVNGTKPGSIIDLPFRSRPGVSEKGNAYINYVVAGPPKLIQKVAD